MPPEAPRPWTYWAPGDLDRLWPSRLWGGPAGAVGRPGGVVTPLGTFHFIVANKVPVRCLAGPEVDRRYQSFVGEKRKAMVGTG